MGRGEGEGRGGEGDGKGGGGGEGRGAEGTQAAAVHCVSCCLSRPNYCMLLKA